jgi:hypothetical protein
VARDLWVHDPLRVVAWRILHDPALLAAVPGFVRPLLDVGGDHDPLARWLSACCVALAVAYFAAAARGAPARVRAALLALAALVVVVVPSLAFIALGAATRRPLGQDGGVVQLPLALEKVLAGRSPYGADYSDSILGKQARVSDFWEPLGGNPILRHHAYLPGTHVVYLPPYLLARTLARTDGVDPADSARRWFDTRLLNLLAWAAAAGLAASLVPGAAARLAAAACVLVNPLIWWHQVFGANDILVMAMILGSLRLARAGRPAFAAALLGFACATKQLAWPFAPFLLAHLAGADSFRALLSRPLLQRLVPLAAIALAVAAVVTVPFALLDPAAMWGDIVVYNVGLRGGDAYPLGGTPGFGLANFVIYRGGVSSLTDLVSFAPAYALLVPLGLLLLAWQLRTGGPGPVLVAGSVALLLSLYVSRVVHPNYLVLAAALLPVGVMAGARLTADVAVVPLLLLGWAVELVEASPLRTAWEDAVAVRLPQHLSGWARALAPRAGPHLTMDPLGLLFGALAAGLATLYAAGSVLRAPLRLRLAVIAAAVALTVVAPAWTVSRIGARTGTLRAQGSLAAAFSAVPVEQMFSTSFRRDPPRAVEALVSSPVPAVDARLAVLAMLVVAAVALARRAEPSSRPTVVAALLLSAAGGAAVVYGGAAADVAVAAGLGLLAWWGRPPVGATPQGMGP